jgi:hypothetical protein
VTGRSLLAMRADGPVQASGETEVAPLGARTRPRLWVQIVLIAAFYGVYSYTRNLFGSALVERGEAPEHAFTNAIKIIDMEKALHIFHEQAIQSWFLGWDAFIRFWNIYYGTFHFIVTIVAFVWLYLRDPARFTRWRNVLGFTTGLAIVGFSLFPLMPPRLLDVDPAVNRFGGGDLEVKYGEGPFDFVDTLAETGGLWSFDSGAVAEVSNQYAAMPSLHIGWSTWCTFVLWPLVRRRWARALLVLYPLATLFCIVVTGNHYYLDAVGGLICLGTGYVLGKGLDDWWHQKRPGKTHLGTPTAV